jgi:hypothetical protein
MPIIGIIEGCEIHQDADGRVHFTADAAIDADGANGQHGAAPAYKEDDSGSEALANGGMRINAHEKVICAYDWARSVVILNTDNEPKIFPGGIIASRTWYRHRNRPAGDPAAYVDAQTVPYIVVPPLIVQRVTPVVRGSRARVTWRDRSVECVVADLGPGNKIGELSIAAADALGMPSSPRHGGVNHKEVFYELWPGVAMNGYELQPA